MEFGTSNVRSTEVRVNTNHWMDYCRLASEGIDFLDLRRRNYNSNLVLEKKVDALDAGGSHPKISLL